MKRILLVSPPRGTLPKVTREHPAPGGLQLPLASMPPLELATIAALTPREFEVDIWDEGTRGAITADTDLGKDYDLIGVTAYMLHKSWALRFAEIAKSKGIPIAIGGPGVSGTPEAARGIFDIIFIGEAELTWPQFLADWKAGTQRSEYRQIQRLDIDDSPAPRWDSIKNLSRDYAVGPVQTTRGCPFDCDFCDVIYLFGRKPRHKAVHMVRAEVAALAKLGMHTIFFCDDNFIGRPRYAKELLRGLIELNNSFARPLRFMTQLTIDLAHDDELLELMADANFQEVCVGLESPREESLREANKPQNYRTDMVADVRKIQSYGIFVRGNLIVGFDHDDVGVFDEIYEFVGKSGLLNALINLLKAPAGTPLQARLEREGRLIDIETDICSDDLELFGGSRALTNIIPEQMTRVELFTNTARLLERLHNWEFFGKCAQEVIENIRYVPKVLVQPEPDGSRAQRVRAAMQNLDPAAQAVVLDVLAAMRRSAPWMMEKMVSTMFRFAGNVLGSARLREALGRQVALETASGFRLKILRRPVSVPQGFQARIQRGAFPMTWRRLLEGLSDERVVPEALIRVWTEFLIRWSDGFGDGQGLEDYHLAHLRELCDRAVERGNSGKLGACWVNAKVTDLSEAQLRRLAGEILSAVQQELRGVPRESLVDLAVSSQGMSSLPASNRRPEQ